MKLLEGKIAVVTGAARGIGEGIVLKFAEHGANIAFTYVSESSEEKAVMLEQKLVSLGIKAKAYKSNAGDYSQCEAFVNDVIKEFGTIDICVNNAGISKDNLLLRMTPDQWNDVININLNSVFYMTKQVIKPMMKARSGSIINMSSVIGEMGNAGQSSYAASKAGIVETDMTSYLKDGAGAEKYKADIPLGKFASTEDIANVSLFLASGLSSYITGQVISVCGGLNI
jgi:3-oxoacyl-[acyl-carrier protein] reductase